MTAPDPKRASEDYGCMAGSMSGFTRDAYRDHVLNRPLHTMRGVTLHPDTVARLATDRAMMKQLSTKETL